MKLNNFLKKKKIISQTHTDNDQYTTIKNVSIDQNL